MPRIPLVFGSGIDRETGQGVVKPGQMRDLRNVHLHRGRVVARKGMELTATIVDGLNPLAKILGGHAMQFDGSGVVVGLESDNEVKAYTVTGVGDTPTLIGVWGVLAGAQRALLAENYLKMFMAHDEPNVDNRLPTKYYTPATGQLHDVRANFDGRGEAAVKFRGVESWLNYMVGWGYGGPTQDRPEMVRISRPGQPHVFLPEDYFIIGRRNEPVLRCIPAANGMVVFKQSEIHLITGRSAQTFGVQQTDGLFGLAASRLAVSVSGTVYFWSNEGPRVTTGGPSEDLALPLDLDVPDPGNLTKAQWEDGFAVYLPDKNEVEFVFGSWSYVFNVLSKEWVYRPRGVSAHCGFTLLSDITATAGLAEPTGYATGVTVAAGADDTKLNVSWTVNGLPSTYEFVEFWTKRAGQPWVHDSGKDVAAGAVQPVVLSGLEPGADYAIAIRYRRGASYAPGYMGETPDGWTAVGHTGSGRTSLSAPAVTGFYNRGPSNAARITLTITPKVGTKKIRVYRDNVVVANASELGPYAEPFEYNDPVTPLATYAYSVVQLSDADGNGSLELEGTGGTLSIFAGLSPRPSLPSGTSPAPGEVDLVFTIGNAAHASEVHGRKDGGAWQSLDTKGGKVLPGEDNAFLVGLAGGSWEFKVRHYQTSGGVTDYSDYSEISAAIVVAAGGETV